MEQKITQTVTYYQINMGEYITASGNVMANNDATVNIQLQTQNGAQFFSDESSRQALHSLIDSELDKAKGFLDV